MGVLPPLRPIQFEGSNVPAAPPDSRLKEITFRTCPGSDLRLEQLSLATQEATVDSYGVGSDAWWRVRCSNLPSRTMRLYHGVHSLRELLRRYGFQDATGCVNHRDAVAHYAHRQELPCRCPPDVPAHLQQAKGVPQFKLNSGVCWFATMLTTTFGNPIVGDMVKHALPEDLQHHCAQCLNDRTSSEALRNAFWERYRVGDDITQPPEMDGRNGFTEFSVLCSKLGIPMLRFREEGGRFLPITSNVTDRAGRQVHVPRPKTDRLHFLVIRFEDGDHSRFPAQRRLQFGDTRYRLIGLYLGQRRCGHQIGISCPTGDWKQWCIGDADLHKDGIGPIHVSFAEEDRDRWWDAWGELVHVTKFGAGGQKFCSISPHNPHESKLEYRSTRKVGEMSADFLYIPAQFPITGRKTIV